MRQLALKLLNQSINQSVKVLHFLLRLTQVINAARILAARPKSKIAQENMDAFKLSWENQVRILTEAVDDITTIDDFLAVSESHILEDVNKCVLALQEKDSDTLDRTAGAIRGRTARVCNVVEAEMENYEDNVYKKRVVNAAVKNSLFYFSVVFFSNSLSNSMWKNVLSSLLYVSHHKFVHSDFFGIIKCF